MIFEGARDDEIVYPRPPRRRWAWLARLLLALGLSACGTPPANNEYIAALTAGCNVAMQLRPRIPDVAPWITAACSTQVAIIALASDPSSLAWLDSLIHTVPKTPIILMPKE